MKKEIKFRAWDKSEYKMSYSDIEFYDDMIGFRFNHWGIEVDGFDDIELMQFTGLRDKNGKEIYEGDIVNPVIMNGTITSGTVLFHAGSFMVKQIGAEWLIDDLYRYDTEVIGNIYENPELINNQ